MRSQLAHTLARMKSVSRWQERVRVKLKERGLCRAGLGLVDSEV